MEEVERLPRDSQIPPESYLKPFDITKFGTADDPCFGKEYDLSAPECRMCGDIEACSIAFMHNSTRLRKQLETENRYKDLEEADLLRAKKIKDWIKGKRAKGWGDTKILRVLMKKFSLTKAVASNHM